MDVTIILGVVSVILLTALAFAFLRKNPASTNSPYMKQELESLLEKNIVNNETTFLTKRIEEKDVELKGALEKIDSLNSELRKLDVEKNRIESHSNDLNSRFEEISKDLEKKQEEDNEHRAEILQLKEDLARLRAASNASDETIKKYESEIHELKNDKDVLSRKNEEKDTKIRGLSNDLSAKEAERNSLEERLEERAKFYEQKFKSLEEQQKTAIENMKSSFSEISDNVLQQKGDLFKKQSAEKIDGILSPLKLTIEAFKERVEKQYDSNNHEFSRLKEQIERLRDSSSTLHLDAKKLTSALSGDVKTQGSWGEMKIEKMLELSGMSEGIDYHLQGKGLGLQDDETGKRQLPDVIVKLPGDRCIVIDAKVSLSSYLEFIEKDEKEHKEDAVKKLLISVKNHIDNLSSKNYHTNKALKTPDYVFMFFPLEGALSLVFDQKIPKTSNTVYEYAHTKNIIIAGQTNMLSTLRVVAEMWNARKQEKHAAEIAELGSKLYDKFYGFVKEMEKIKKSIKAADSTVDTAMSKLSEGRGNIVSLAQKMKNKGLNTKYSLDDKYVEEAEAEQNLLNLPTIVNE